MGRPSRVSYYKAKRAYDAAVVAFYNLPTVIAAIAEFHKERDKIDRKIKTRKNRIEKIEREIYDLQDEKWKAGDAHSKRIDSAEFLMERIELRIGALRAKLNERKRFMEDGGWNSWNLDDDYEEWLRKAELSDLFGVSYNKIFWWEIDYLHHGKDVNGKDCTWWSTLSGYWRYPGIDQADALLRCTTERDRITGEPRFSAIEEVEEDDPTANIKVSTCYGNPLRGTEKGKAKFYAVNPNELYEG